MAQAPPESRRLRAAYLGAFALIPAYALASAVGVHRLLF
jgi:hypothetical protein